MMQWRKHGKWLMAYVILAVIVELVSLQFDRSLLSEGNAVSADMPAEWLYASVVLDALALCSLAATWLWSRWGAVGYVAATLAPLLLQLLHKWSLAHLNWFDVAGPLLFTALIRREW